jgi:hypothetical protein
MLDTKTQNSEKIRNLKSIIRLETKKEVLEQSITNFLTEAGFSGIVPESVDEALHNLNSELRKLGKIINKNL